MKKLTANQIGKIFIELFQDEGSGYKSDAYFRAVLNALNHSLVRDEIEKQIEYNDAHQDTVFNFVDAVLNLNNK